MICVLNAKSPAHYVNVVTVIQDVHWGANRIPLTREGLPVSPCTQSVMPAVCHRLLHVAMWFHANFTEYDVDLCSDPETERRIQVKPILRRKIPLNIISLEVISS